MNYLKNVLAELVPIFFILTIPGYLITADFASPSRFFREQPEAMWILLPLLVTWGLLFVGQLLPPPRQVSIRSHLQALTIPLHCTVGVCGSIALSHPANFPTLASPLSLVRGGVAVLLAVGGAALFGWTLRLFHKTGRGTLSPLNPPSQFVVQGPYRYTRNPMITAVLLILISLSVLLWSQPLLLWTCTFLCAKTVYFLAAEEPMLAQRFGAAYLAYKQAVPRWIPRLHPFSPIA